MVCCQRLGERVNQCVETAFTKTALLQKQMWICYSCRDHVVLWTDLQSELNVHSQSIQVEEVGTQLQNDILWVSAIYSRKSLEVKGERFSLFLTPSLS